MTCVEGGEIDPLNIQQTGSKTGEIGGAKANSFYRSSGRQTAERGLDILKWTDGNELRKYGNKNLARKIRCKKR